MLRPEDLVGLPDFPLGSLTLSPSRRMVERGARSVSVEPRVMQVLVLLARDSGNVITRQQLFNEIWGGVPVGDDSLNRAVAGARRALALDGDKLELETIPRTGYRLLVQQDEQVGSPTYSRRGVARAGAAAAVLAGAGGLGVWRLQTSTNREFVASMERGSALLAYGAPSSEAVPPFRRAAELRPSSAQAHGSYAYALTIGAENPETKGGSRALEQAEQAKAAALALDPAEPFARLAELNLQKPLLDFATSEDRLRDILKSNPDNTSAMRQLWNLLQCVGRSGEALALAERAVKLAPLGAANHFPRAQLLWILGRTAEADRVSEWAIRQWPLHRFVRFARFTILAFTGRPRAALAMLENPETRPQSFTPEGVNLWRLNLIALEERTPSSIAASRNASVDGAKQNLQLASQSVLVLSALGELDAAFEIANDLFVGGDVNPERRTGSLTPVKSTAWRFAPWLFTPPLAPVRADPRFQSVCDSAGLTEYWATRGVRPDYQLGVA